MSAPRLEINLDKLQHNARTLIKRLAPRGISVTAVTKAFLGAPEIALALLRAGVRSLGDSRIENIEMMRRAGIPAAMTLIRTPMLSQVDRVVAHADVSFNSELEVISQLSVAAQRAKRIHGVVLMVELGDLREGIMPGELEQTARKMLRLPNIQLLGIGTNLACRSGVSPDSHNMNELSALADSLDATFGTRLSIVTGGNSANLQWALSGADTGHINNLRLGEAILLGCDPLHRQPIDGLHTDTIELVAEVIEAKEKPTQPRGELAQNAFGEKSQHRREGNCLQAILAIGQQDTDPYGLQPPHGVNILGASSDHLIIDASDRPLTVGEELRFGLNYSALLRAMTSPFISRVITTNKSEQKK